MKKGYENMTQERSERRTRGNSGIVAALINRNAEEGPGRPHSEREVKKTYTLMFYPGVYEEVKYLASLEQRSISDVVGSLLVRYVQENQDKLPNNNSFLKR